MSNSLKESVFLAWSMHLVFNLVSFHYASEIAMLSMCPPLSTSELADFLHQTWYKYSAV
jgi:hypothetical protein